MRVVLAGGGTAGHTSPLIATAEALRARDPEIEITCVGTAKGLETRVIPTAGLPLELIPAVPLPRSLSTDLLTLPFRLAGAVRDARRILIRHKAQVAAGFGGYASLPVYLAARTLGIPVVVHEQNALPGVANKIAVTFAKAVAVSFPNTGLPKQQYVGLPIRAALATLDRDAARAAAREAFRLPAEGPVVLVSGGSQGALRLNTALREALPEVLATGVSVLHVLGPKNMAPDIVDIDAEGAVYRPVAYVDRMEDAYAAADLMVGRSGAGTVVETAVVGLPGVFVPLPHGNGEQARNATALVEAGGAVLVPDADLDAARFVSEVVPLVTNPDRLHAMAEAGRGLVPGDAAQVLADLVIGAAKAD